MECFVNFPTIFWLIFFPLQKLFGWSSKTVSKDAFYFLRCSLISNYEQRTEPVSIQAVCSTKVSEVTYFCCFSMYPVIWIIWVILASFQNACFELMGLNSSYLLHGHFSLHSLYKEIALCTYIVFLFPEDLLFSWYFSNEIKGMEKFRPELKVKIDWYNEN